MSAGVDGLVRMANVVRGRGVEVVITRVCVTKEPHGYMEIQEQKPPPRRPTHNTTDGDFLEPKILPFTPLSGSNIHQVI